MTRFLPVIIHVMWSDKSNPAYIIVRHITVFTFSGTQYNHCGEHRTSFENQNLTHAGKQKTICDILPLTNSLVISARDAVLRRGYRRRR